MAAIEQVAYHGQDYVISSLTMRKKANRYTKDDQVFIYQMLILRSQGVSYPVIGKAYNKDHSTVIHWCKRFNIEVGKPVLSHEEFDIKINKKVAPNKYKYRHILDEPINVGKRNYKEYLIASIK